MMKFPENLSRSSSLRPLHPPVVVVLRALPTASYSHTVHQSHVEDWMDAHVQSGQSLGHLVRVIRPTHRAVGVVDSRVQVIELEDVVRHKGNGIKHQHRGDQQGHFALLQCGDAGVFPHHRNHHIVGRESHQEGNQTAKHSQERPVREVRAFIPEPLVAEGHAQGREVALSGANRGEVQHGAGDDADQDPDEDAGGLGVAGLDVGSGEEGEPEGHTAVHAYRHDEEDAHVEVAGEQKPLEFAHGVAKHPVLVQRVVDDEQGQGEHVQQVADGQVAGQDDPGVPAPSLSDRQQPQGEQVSGQSHEELHAVHGGQQGLLELLTRGETGLHLHFSRHPFPFCLRILLDRFSWVISSLRILLDRFSWEISCLRIPLDRFSWVISCLRIPLDRFFWVILCPATSCSCFFRRPAFSFSWTSFLFRISRISSSDFETGKQTASLPPRSHLGQTDGALLGRHVASAGVDLR
ncbi:hypothetical protein EYF80_019719 [Liparis tanakae]|uniref:Uncharacterized protein n=1 Tax=Liparis tanakae TaxID=230148 RepID=A0A4Z2HYJ0_9TELE|nr:hypothetical protein EYF80_019719 [Liparis tanakae]